MSYEIYSGALIMMDNFQNRDSDMNFKYSYENSMKDILINRYKIDEVAGKGNALSKAINLLEWISSHIYHIGNYKNNIQENAINLLEYSFDNGLDRGINCRCLSIILSECYLTIGLKSRAVYLMPFSPYDCDNHVVCEVFIPESNKWIMIDPTYNLYIMDEYDNILNLLELRKALANRDTVKFSDNINYNGDYNIDFNEMKSYYAKNLFYFKCKEIQCLNSENLYENKSLILAPFGYDVKKSELININYLVNEYGYDEYMKKLKSSIEKEKLLYISGEEFYKLPL